MTYSYKPQKDSEFICTDDYCGIVFTSFNSAKVMLNSFNVVVVVDSYATCIKSHIDGYFCFSYKLVIYKGKYFSFKSLIPANCR